MFTQWMCFTPPDDFYDFEYLLWKQHVQDLRGIKARVMWTVVGCTADSQQEAIQMFWAIRLTLTLNNWNAMTCYFCVTVWNLLTHLSVMHHCPSWWAFMEFHIHSPLFWFVYWTATTLNSMCLWRKTNRCMLKIPSSESENSSQRPESWNPFVKVGFLLRFYD